MENVTLRKYKQDSTRYEKVLAYRSRSWWGMGVAMTPQELTNRYDNLCKTMTPTQAYSILQEETGRKKNNIKTTISKYKGQLGTQPSQLKATLIDSTKKKTEELIAQQVEENVSFFDKCNKMLQDALVDLIDGMKNHIALNKDNEDYGSGSYNQMSSALYRAYATLQESTMKEESKVNNDADKNYAELMSGLVDKINEH